MSGPKASQRRRPAPLSIRFSEDEKTLLRGRAEGLPLSTYIKRVVFASEGQAIRRGPRRATVDRELAARLLGALGASRLSSNLAQLARQANLGNLLFDERTQAEIHEAYADIREMRGLLLRALGKDADRARSPAAAFGLPGQRRPARRRRTGCPR